MRPSPALAASASFLVASALLAPPLLAVTPASAAPLGPLVINEVESNGDATDWVELLNTGTETADVSGFVFRDADDTHTYVIPDGTTIAAGEFFVLDQNEFGFGLGKEESARLFMADGVTLADSYEWVTHATTTYGRTDAGTFAQTLEATKGAPNVFPHRAASVRINEVESSGDSGDWVELLNTGDAAADVSGLVFRDADDTHSYVIPAGTSIPAGGFLVLEETAFGFGLGGGDSARLFLEDGVTVLDSYAWTAHATTTYGRNPDGVGPFALTQEPSKGTANVFAPAPASPVRINEIESNGDTTDWVELINTGTEPVDASGWIVKDNDDTHVATLPAGSVIPAGGFFIVEEPVMDFGLGSDDSVRVFAADGFTVIDSFSWTGHALTTLGRCPDGTGDFIVTGGGTKAALNSCDGPVEGPDIETSPWPGGATTTPVDVQGYFSGDLSGLVHEADGTERGALWAVQNGDGLLFELGWDGANWVAEREFALAYPDGGGTVDAEGVTVTSAGSAGGVFVASERNNDNKSVSRPSILEYTLGSDAVLSAATEWDLTADLPVLGSNSGLEGIAWIPDAALTASGFIDQSTNAVYTPALYPGHGDGLFFVGVEGNGMIYAYALATDGSYDRIAAFESGFPGVMELVFDAASGDLWAVCDEVCEGRMAVLSLDAGAFAVETVYERPSGMENLANEGFAVAAACVDGVRAAFWADDAGADGHSLREGTLDCGTTGGPGTGGPGTGEPGGGGSGPGATPVPVTDDKLTEGSRGTVSAPDSARPGQLVTVTVGMLHAGRTVNVWLHSDPMFLGARTVSAAGTVSVTIPANTPVGVHRLVVLAEDGSVIGWTEIRVAAATLQVTGADSSGLGIAGLALVGLGLGTVLVRRRLSAVAA